MNYEKISKILGIIVLVGGLIVMFGWFAGIPILTSILPFWVTMKFTTALSFFLCGIVLYYINIHLYKEGKFSEIILPISSLLVLLIMSLLLISVIVGVRTGIEDLFVKEAVDAVKTTTPGRPSAGTMLSFILISISGFLVMGNASNIKKKFLLIGKIVFVLGGLAILGYLLNIPLLYYTLEGWSTAMAFHTAIFFVLLGAGLIFSGKVNVGQDTTNLKKTPIIKVKLQTKLISRILLIVFISLFFVEMINFTNTKNALEEKSIAQLESTAQTLKNFINQVLEEQKEEIEIAATHTELTNEELKEIRDLQDEVYEIFVLDDKGIVIASSNEFLIGRDDSLDEYFTNVKNKTYFKPPYLSEYTGKRSITVSTPFGDGLLVALIDLITFEKIVSDRTGLGETGEALLAYKNERGAAVFFTERRFEEDVFEEEDQTLPIYEALDKKEKVILGSKDYRNVKVIAVTKYIDTIDIGMVVKIDEKEAFSDVTNLQRLVILVGVIVLVLIALVLSFVAKSISKELEHLRETVDEITKGNLDVQLEQSNIYEIQELTNSLNRILASLKIAILKTGTSKTALGIGTKEAIEKANVAEADKLKAQKIATEKISELERFVKLSLGRERKMIELKKRIAELETKLNPPKKKIGVVGGKLAKK